jgi:hypothetical protein
VSDIVLFFAAYLVFSLVQIITDAGKSLTFSFQVPKQQQTKQARSKEDSGGSVRKSWAAAPSLSLMTAVANPGRSEECGEHFTPCFGFKHNLITRSNDGKFFPQTVGMTCCCCHEII